MSTGGQPPSSSSFTSFASNIAVIKERLSVCQSSQITQATIGNADVVELLRASILTVSEASQLPRVSLSTEPIREAGFILYNTDDDLIYISDGTQWIALGMSTSMSSAGLTLTPFRSDPANNIFDNWDDLIAALATVPRPISVFVEGTFPEAIVTTPGTYDFSGVRLEGAIFPDSAGNITNRAVLRVGPTTILECLSYLSNIALVFQSSTPAITLPYSPTPLGTQITLINSTLSPDSGVFGIPPIVSPVSITSGTSIAMINSDISNFVAGTPPTLDVAGGASLFIDNIGTVRYQAIGGGVWALGGTGTFSMTTGPETSITPFPQDPLVTITTFPRTTYRPSTPADWSGSTNISIEDALNRIASLVGPIP